MASTTPIKDRGLQGFLFLLLVGLLLPAVLVSGQTTGANPSSNTAATTGGTGNTSSATAGMNYTSNTSMSPGWTSAPTNPSTNSSMTTNYPGGMNVTALYCPTFTCNYSDCYAMYNSQNATWCPAGTYCELIKQMDMTYNANCSASCRAPCANSSQVNCCVGCCNTTGCLNSTFASMMMTTTTTVSTTLTTTTPAPTTTATTTPAPTTPAPTTTTAPNNGKKCHQGVCDGDTCYTTFKNNALQTCSNSEAHCQLKKGTGTTSLQWTAGCTTNCSNELTCKPQGGLPCHQECCTAATTSCLLLNGTLNVFSSATRGPYLHTELTASLLCLLAIVILL